MIFEVDGHKVKIEVMNIAAGSNEYNDSDTRNFLVSLTCMAHDARSYNEEYGYDGCAEEDRRYAKAFGNAWRAMDEGRNEI